MLDDYSFEKFEENSFPLAYLITFRTYGTWLHGDERGSFSRRDINRFGARFFPPNDSLRKAMQRASNGEEFTLNGAMRVVVHRASCDICERRGYELLAVNVRTNHVHAVVAAQRAPERIADELKAHGTKFLREAKLIGPNDRVWARGRSRRYLWKPEHVAAAIEYVMHGQGDIPFDLP
ncbi:MAG: transposase [Acidobacteriota bacterium]